MLNRSCIAAYVLAGGQSRRMGTDKAGLMFGGVSLAARAVALAGHSADHVRLVGARADLSGIAEVIPDAVAGQGPLGGVVAALKDAQAGGFRWALVLVVDQPLLTAALVEALADGMAERTADNTMAILAEADGRRGFPMLMDVRLGAALAAELAAGRRRLIEAVESACKAAGGLLQTGPRAGWSDPLCGRTADECLTNVNTQAEFERLAGSIL